MDFIVSQFRMLNSAYNKYYFITNNKSSDSLYLRGDGTVDGGMVINNRKHLGFFRRKCDAERMLRAFKEGQQSGLQFSVKIHIFGPYLKYHYVQERKAFYIATPRCSLYLRNNGTISSSMEISSYNGKGNLGYFRRKSDAQHMLNAYESGQKNR